MSVAGLLGGLIFSSIGLIGFSYGKRTQNFSMLAVGSTLMVYPYFITDVWAVYLVGAGLTAVLWRSRE